MKSDFSSLAFVFRQNLVASGISVSLGHTQQLLATSLGAGVDDSYYDLDKADA